ncbi:MAG: hypothetical protein SVW57_05345, partial [Thermodesulfobacteriota bacterium]|nr:hypothetical protein [Thermodesulfobacteriota bacterium]
MIIINGLTKSNQLLLMLLPSMFLAVIILISPLFGVLITPILIFLLVAFMNVQTALLLAIAITPILKDVVIFHISIVDLRIGEILWLLLSATFVLKYLAYGKIIVERFPITKFLILLILAHLLSVAVSNYPLVSLRETVQMLYLAMVFIVISNILQTRALIEKAVFMMVISAALFIGFGVFQTVTGQPPFPSIEVDAAGITVLKCGFKEQFTLFGGHLLKRTSSFFLGPVETAAYLVTILSLILSILLGKGLDLRKRIGLCMIYLPGMFLLLMTYSRAGLLVFLLSVLITAFLKGRYIACG